MNESLVVRRKTHIAAPCSTVFGYLTDPEKILRWMGEEANTEPRPGGLFLLKNVGGRRARGEFREVAPVHRLSYSFGWEGDDEAPPGSSLIDQHNGARMRLTQTGLPNGEQCDGHAKGWPYHMRKLSIAFPGPDTEPMPAPM